MGAIFKIPACIIYWMVGLWGLVVCLGIVAEHLGFIGCLVAFFVFPVTLLAAPWYEALANSNWFPAILVYGGGLFAHILARIGASIDGE